MFQRLSIILLFTLNPVLAMEQCPLDESIQPQAIAPAFNCEQDTQEALNQWVAKNGADIYFYLNNSPLFGYPDDPQKPDYYTHSKDWRVYQPYGENRISFIKKKGVPASEALQSLLESEGRFDCRIAQRIVFMECMHRLMGDKVFDACCEEFEKEESQDIFEQVLSKGQPATRELSLGGNANINPYFRLVCQEKQFLYNDFLYDKKKIGYFGYIPNIDEYAYLHFHGYLRGDHALCYVTSVRRKTGGRIVR